MPSESDSNARSCAVSSSPSEFVFDIRTDSFHRFAQHLESVFPFLRVTKTDVDGNTVLQSEHGGMRVFSIYQGAGEVWLQKGYRTQEGDGEPLPSEQYRSDSCDPQFSETFHCRRTGYSTKTVDSWERLMTGDQLVVTENEPLRVRGNFQCFSLENIERKESHVSATRRLRFILDTAGGCSPGFDSFRRLSTTWVPTAPDEVGDGINFFNSHVINIPAEHSPTHFHPKNPIGDGTAQHEFYLVLDPNVYSLATAGLKPEIVLYPDLADLSRYEIIPLRPGMIVSIPPGVGHRGLNVFAIIMTLPGFKPGNDFYLDKDIYERTGGASPYNSKHLGSKNYERLEEFL